MTKRIVARWTGWDGEGLEHLALDLREAEIVAEGMVVTGPDTAIAAQYRIVCNGAWCVRHAEISMAGGAAR